MEVITEITVERVGSLSVLPIYTVRAIKESYYIIEDIDAKKEISVLNSCKYLFCPIYFKGKVIPKLKPSKLLFSFFNVFKSIKIIAMRYFSMALFLFTC